MGAAALITAVFLTLLFTGCSNANGNKLTPKPKYSVAFSGRNGNGTLKAKVEGEATETSTSPVKVEEDKTVTFTAKANDGYRVKAWTLEGLIVREVGTNTEYKLTVKMHASVNVFFEKIPPTKYTVTLTKTEHGTVTASPAIPADKLVAKDTEITFTATANAGYRVGSWSVTPSEALQSGGEDRSPTATIKITADTTVSMSFEEIPKGGKLTPTADGIGKIEAKGLPLVLQQ